MSQRRITGIFFGTLLLVSAGCDSELGPVSGSTGFSGILRFKHWPSADSVHDMRIVAFETYPSDSAGILGTLLAGHGAVYPAIGTKFPAFVDSLPYDFTLSDGTNLQVKSYDYVIVAQQFGPNVLTDWRPVGVFPAAPGSFTPARVRVILHHDIPGIDILVDFSEPSPEAMALTPGIIVVLFLHAAAPGGGGSVAGRVIAGGEGGPLPGVNVRLEGTVRGTTTNMRGEYRIGDLPAGKRTLIFSLVGYLREVRPDVTVEEGKETALNVAMTQSAIQAEQVVVTASKREQSLRDVPLSISVLDAADISQRNSASLEDALRYIPGVNMTGTQVNIRGSSGYSLGAGSRVLMLLDGVPFLAGDTGELNFESIPMGQVDRIEVVKGASSALYGSNALGGVINIITKPIPETPETIVRTYGGIYNSPAYAEWNWSDKSRFFSGQSFSHMRKAGDLGVSVFFSRQIDDGYRQNDYHRRYNVLMKMREDLSSQGSITLTFGLAYQFMGQFLYWRNVDSALITPTNHQSDNIKSTRYFLNGLYNTALSDRFLFTVKTMWYHNDWGFQQSGDPERTESLSEGVRAEALSTFLPCDSQTLTFGADGNIDMIAGDMFGDRRIGGLALFAQDEAKLPGDLTVTLGARFDAQSVGLTGEAGHINPKVALLYQPAAGTALRASFGEGFRVPSLPEAFVAAGSTGLLAVPNKDLKPERSRSYEAGISQALGTVVSVDVAAFRSDIDDLIEPGLYAVGSGLEIQWRNVTRARVQGIETSCRGTFFNSSVSCEFGYTYVYPEDLTLNDILKYRPRHVLHAGLRGGFARLTASADFRFVSRIERIDDELVEAGVIPDGDQRVPIYVTDIRLGADVSFAGIPLSVSLNINNLFQHNYVELIGNVMPPRTYVLVLESRF